MSKKKPLKQLWADIGLVDELKQVKAKRVLNGNPVDSLAQLTNEMQRCPSFPLLKEELELFGKKKSGLKFDKKRGFL